MVRRAATLLAIFVLAAGGPAAADTCPNEVGEAGFDALARQLAAIPTCKAALARLHDCAWGSSADTQFSPIVVKTCEAVFLARLSAAGRRNYAKRMQMCAYEYAHQDGTLYMSAAALCQADLAASFAANPALADKPVRASFDCEAAKSVLETAICADETLGQADIILSESYKAALKAADAKSRPAFVDDQRRWHAALADTCRLDPTISPAALACLTRAFEARFTRLDACENDPDCFAKADDAPPAPRASFDCQAPRTPLEIAICADAELGRADIGLAHAYRDADARLGPAAHAGLVASERKWLRFVAGACPLGAIGGIPPVIARACVRAAFGTRIAQLGACSGEPEAARLACLDRFEVSEKK